MKRQSTAIYKRHSYTNVWPLAKKSKCLVPVYCSHPTQSVTAVQPSHLHSLECVFVIFAGSPVTLSSITKRLLLLFDVFVTFVCEIRMSAYIMKCANDNIKTFLNVPLCVWVYVCISVWIEPQPGAVHGASGPSPLLWSAWDIWGYGVLLWGCLTPSAAPQSSHTAASSGSPP